MLSDEERRRIRSEEVAAARAALARRQAISRRAAARVYRRQVRHRLRPRGRLLLAGLGTLALLGALVVAVLRDTPQAPDDTAGGIATSVLMSRCEDQLEARAGERLHFPGRREVNRQLTAGPDGKRWDGSYTRSTPAGATLRTDFSCSYTVATDSISTELIAP